MKGAVPHLLWRGCLTPPSEPPARPPASPLDPFLLVIATYPRLLIKHDYSFF
ncbi:hypothetical protein MBAV_001923 [Candidatus Magnetobacterium bavaricum]|uniref:Uncharacterized protein n=1 Tax=Candidatus Magnetobacterium bavaricum TaxID=29290 RepID=A0A0F3GV86_9BACT|nr:hypothetical protein MBAV_001923 [Candidatus Magnetobacterium bavaricum]